MRRHIVLGPIVAIFVAAGACTEADKSRNPLSPNVAGPIEGVAITAPGAVSPANGATITVGDPVVLRFQNATTNGERPLRQHVQVAADPGFSDLLVNDRRVPVSDEGQTEYRVQAELAADGTYFWRVRGLDGANTGRFSEALSFEVVEPVVIEPPVPAIPIDDEETLNTTPVLVVQNGGVRGPAGDVVYRFEVARDRGFKTMEAVEEVPRSGGGQTLAPLGDVGHDGRFWWRVRGSNGSVTSAYSSVASFRTPAAPAPPPEPEPPPPDPDPEPPPPDPDPEPPPGGPSGDIEADFWRVNRGHPPNTHSLVNIVFPQLRAWYGTRVVLGARNSVGQVTDIWVDGWWIDCILSNSPAGGIRWHWVRHDYDPHLRYPHQ